RLVSRCSRTSRTRSWRPARTAALPVRTEGGMRIFLAGATGVVGRRILPLLIEVGHQVTALTRKPDRVPALRALGAEPVVTGVYDRDTLIDAVREAAPDVVMHQLTDLAGVDYAANAAIRRHGTRN